MERCGKQEAVVITKFDLKHADDVYLCALRARLRLIV